MKTSFYFVLWISLYILIDLIGDNNLRAYSYYIAFASVLVIRAIVNKITANPQAYMANREGAAFLEIVYQNDYKKYLGILRRKMIFNIATFIYFVITVIFLLMTRADFAIIAIFLFFGICSALTMSRSCKSYNQARIEGEIEMSDDEESIEMYNTYSEMRKTYQADQMCPPPTWKDKLLRGLNFGFSILAIILGILFIVTFAPGILGHGVVRVGSAMYVAYGGLAFIYGVNDLVTSSHGYNFSFK